jgi:hypothetical protein
MHRVDCFLGKDVSAELAASMFKTDVCQEHHHIWNYLVLSQEPVVAALSAVVVALSAVVAALSAVVAALSPEIWHFSLN